MFFKNCPDRLWEKHCSCDRENLFQIRDWRLRICRIFAITRTICLCRKMLKQNYFLTCCWMFKSDIIQWEKLEYQLEKNNCDVVETHRNKLEKVLYIYINVKVYCRLRCFFLVWEMKANWILWKGKGKLFGFMPSWRKWTVFWQTSAL